MVNDREIVNQSDFMWMIGIASIGRKVWFSVGGN